MPSPSPYRERYPTTQTAAEARAAADGARCRVAGRVMLWRVMGKLVFGTLRDRSGTVQISLQPDQLGDERFAELKTAVKIGDFVGVDGERYTTKKGEPTVRADEVEILSVARRSLPDKWAGLTNPEVRLRKRYLDLLTSEETRHRFLVRTRLVRAVRAFLDGNGFLEVETPILQAAASGAAARPFQTHHNALDRDLYLRISPETYLKRVVAGSFDRVYELGRNFRNEGVDAHHLQEFTMLEWYASYWNYRDNMAFLQDLLREVVPAAVGSSVVVSEGVSLDFGAEFPEVDYREAVREATGIDLRAVRTYPDLLARASERWPGLADGAYPSYASLVDALYKRAVRPQLIQPTFLTRHPAELVPLARRSDDDPDVLDMFQLVVQGTELVKAYSELIDPVEQRARLEEQVAMREAGDEETMMLEEDFLEAMEYGMPPMSGLGMGIDRLTALITDAGTLRETVLFPAMRDDPGLAIDLS
jgi:lysyl-tRNA synthetase class 2